MKAHLPINANDRVTLDNLFWGSCPGLRYTARRAAGMGALLSEPHRPARDGKGAVTTIRDPDSEVRAARECQLKQRTVQAVVQASGPGAETFVGPMAGEAKVSRKAAFQSRAGSRPRHAAGPRRAGWLAATRLGALGRLARRIRSCSRRHARAASRCFGPSWSRSADGARRRSALNPGQARGPGYMLLRAV